MVWSFIMDIEYITKSKLLKAPEVAEILNISRAMAYRLIQMGEIRSVHIGVARRLRPEESGERTHSRGPRRDRRRWPGVRAMSLECLCDPGYRETGWISIFDSATRAPEVMNRTRHFETSADPAGSRPRTRNHDLDTGPTR